MAFPVYEGSGSIAAATDFGIDIPYPSDIANNDILIIQLLDASDDVFNVPVGWTKVSEINSVNASFAWMWKRATGTESGTLTVSSNSDAGDLVAGMMCRVSGCITSGIPFEGLQTVGVTVSQLIDVPAVTTLGNERLVISLFHLEAYYNTSFPTDYTLGHGEGTLTGTGGVLAAFWQQVATAQTTTARTSVPSNSCNWGTFTFALIPEGSPSGQINSSINSSSIVAASMNAIGRVSSITEGASVIQANVQAFSQINTSANCNSVVSGKISAKGKLSTNINQATSVEAVLNAIAHPGIQVSGKTSITTPLRATDRLNASVFPYTNISANISKTSGTVITASIIGNCLVTSAISAVGKLNSFSSGFTNVRAVFFMPNTIKESVSGESPITFMVSGQSKITKGVINNSFITRELLGYSKLN